MINTININLRIFLKLDLDAAEATHEIQDGKEIRQDVPMLL